MIFIKTIIKGRKISHLYEVDFHQIETKVDGEDKLVYYGIPSLKCKDEITYETICEVDDVLDNSLIYTSDEERVLIDSRRFRTDLCAYEILTNKIISEEIVNREESETLLAIHMSAFNEDMINSNEKLKTYCNVHKLNPRETDVLELWKIVYPQSSYMFVEGKMCEVKAFDFSALKAEYCCSGTTINNNPVNIDIKW